MSNDRMLKVGEIPVEVEGDSSCTRIVSSYNRLLQIPYWLNSIPIVWFIILRPGFFMSGECNLLSWCILPFKKNSMSNEQISFGDIRTISNSENYSHHCCSFVSQIARRCRVCWEWRKTLHEARKGSRRKEVPRAWVWQWVRLCVTCLLMT